MPSPVVLLLQPRRLRPDGIQVGLGGTLCLASVRSALLHSLRPWQMVIPNARSATAAFPAQCPRVTGYGHTWEGRIMQSSTSSIPACAPQHRATGAPPLPMPACAVWPLPRHAPPALPCPAMLRRAPQHLDNYCMTNPPLPPTPACAVPPPRAAVPPPRSQQALPCRHWYPSRAGTPPAAPAPAEGGKKEGSNERPGVSLQ